MMDAKACMCKIAIATSLCHRTVCLCAQWHIGLQLASNSNNSCYKGYINVNVQEWSNVSTCSPLPIFSAHLHSLHSHPMHVHHYRYRQHESQYEPPKSARRTLNCAATHPIIHG